MDRPIPISFFALNIYRVAQVHTPRTLSAHIVLIQSQFDVVGHYLTKSKCGLTSNDYSVLVCASRNTWLLPYEKHFAEAETKN